ncbi:MAG: hypothetical protein ABSB29_09735 [Nitrososphaerales archaeon]|jgi:hypothetical protein
MKITKLEQARRRKAVSGIFGSMIMFAMLFTAGIGFFLFVNTTTLQGAQANQQKQQALQQASQEKLSMEVGLSTIPDPWGQTGDLWLRITNVGSSPATLIDVFVTNTAADRIMSKSQVTPGTQYLSTFPDINYSLPLTILPGFSTAQMSGCGSIPGCDIAINQTSYNYASGGSPVVVSVLTSTGNIFSAQYPSPPGASTVTMTNTFAINITSTVGGGNPGGNVLVVQMVASPTQTFSCADCLYDTVTVYNYGIVKVTGVSLSPAVPLASLTGSAKVSSTRPCNLTSGTMTNGSIDIQAYSGSGAPPKVVYLCTYSANPNGFGGFVSFTGQARGTYNGGNVTSGQAISNPVQIGGPVSVLNQGPFSANFFFFKYSACTYAPLSITLTNGSGRVGDAVNVKGTGFAPASTITIKFNGATQTTAPATITTSAAGAFTATFVVPASPLGNQTVTATDARVNTASAAFTVTTVASASNYASFGGFSYSTFCPTTPSSVTFANLPTASLIKGDGSYYVAFYIQLTNNFNVPIPILPYTYFMTDPTSGGESPFFIVGNPGNNQNISSNPKLPYIPNYTTTTPKLTAYPSTCIATSTASCIRIAPYENATVTFAACDIGSTSWNWAGSAYGDMPRDLGSKCTTRPPQYVPDESTYLTILITFVYKGQVYTQQIPFVGQTVT